MVFCLLRAAWIGVQLGMAFTVSFCGSLLAVRGGCFDCARLCLNWGACMAGGCGVVVVVVAVVLGVVVVIWAWCWCWAWCFGGGVSPSAVASVGHRGAGAMRFSGAGGGSGSFGDWQLLVLGAVLELLCSTEVVG